MADISMCKDKECPKAGECYRQTAQVNELYQAFADFKWNKETGCKSFWNNKE